MTADEKAEAIRLARAGVSQREISKALGHGENRMRLHRARGRDPKFAAELAAALGQHREERPKHRPEHRPEPRPEPAREVIDAEVVMPEMPPRSEREHMAVRCPTCGRMESDPVERGELFEILGRMARNDGTPEQRIAVLVLERHLLGAEQHAAKLRAESEAKASASGKGRVVVIDTLRHATPEQLEAELAQRRQALGVGA